MRANVVVTPCFLKITLFSVMAVMHAGGHPNARSTNRLRELPTLPTATNLATDWVEVEKEQKPSSQGMYPEPFNRRRPPAEKIDAGCRKRVVCEAARTLTEMIPVSNFWQAIARGRPEPKNAYFAAWSKGLSSKDCSQIYPDCSDNPAGMMLQLVREIVGAKGFLASFLERLAVSSAPRVSREPDAPRPSLVMDRLRHSHRRWTSNEWHTSSHDLPRHHG